MSETSSIREFSISVDDKDIYCQYINEKFSVTDKPWLVFLHEGLGSIRQWKDFPALLSNALSLPTLVYDRYGYGRSSPLKEKRTSDYLEREGRQALPALIAALDITQKIILVGHSDGGSIALVFGGTYPDKTTGIISEAAHLFLEDISISGIAAAEETFRKGRLKALLERYHGERTETAFYGWATTWLNPDFKEWSLEHFLTTISAPTLVIQGVNDEYGSEVQVNSIINNVAGYKEKWMLLDCGHVPHLEHKQLVLQRMTDFINTHCL